MKDNTAPLVSIVIPTYNREQYISKAVDSAISQTYNNIEVVIVDNCSTDKTWEMLSSYKNKNTNIRIFQNESNLGPVRNWQRCFEQAKGEFVKILWSDDWIDPTFVERAIEEIDSETAFVISNVSARDNSGNERSRSTLRPGSFKTESYINDVLYFRREGFPVSPGCALFRTKDLRSALILKVPNNDGLDSSCNGAGNDLLLFLTTASKYPKIKIIGETLSFFRVHDDSFSMGKDLTTHYEWAIVYFIKEHYNNKYNWILKLRYWYYLKKKKLEGYQNLYDSVPVKGASVCKFMGYIIKKKLNV